MAALDAGLWRRGTAETEGGDGAHFTLRRGGWHGGFGTGGGGRGAVDPGPWWRLEAERFEPPAAHDHASCGPAARGFRRGQAAGTESACGSGGGAGKHH